jgi:hypothetical protein
VSEPGIVAVAVAVIAACAAIAAPVVTVVVQRRVQRENRADHFSVESVLVQLVCEVAQIKADFQELKQHTKGTTDEP